MTQSTAAGATAPGGAGLGRRLTEEVPANMKGAFVAKDEIIDLLGVCQARRRIALPRPR
jgi:hypothetical protein